MCEHLILQYKVKMLNKLDIKPITEEQLMECQKPVKCSKVIIYYRYFPLSRMQLFCSWPPPFITSLSMTYGKTLQTTV